jgi:hypothetical protein
VTCTCVCRSSPSSDVPIHGHIHCIHMKEFRRANGNCTAQQYRLSASRSYSINNAHKDSSHSIPSQLLSKAMSQVQHSGLISPAINTIVHLRWNLNAVRHPWMNIRNTLQQSLDNLILPLISSLLDGLHLHFSVLVRLLLGLLVSAGVLQKISVSIAPLSISQVLRFNINAGPDLPLSVDAEIARGFGRREAVPQPQTS